MSAPPRQAFVGMGANLGDRAATMLAATERLRHSPLIVSVETSSIYETDPVGELNQPNFLNQVLGLETYLGPEDLLRTLMTIEREFGRERTLRWGPRTLDLDLLAYEGESRDTADLVLPHPRMNSRAFVIVPLREILSKPRYINLAWDALRTLAEQPVDVTGVRRFEIR